MSKWYLCLIMILGLYCANSQNAAAQIDSILSAKRKYAGDSLNYWRIGVTVPFAPLSRMAACQTSWQIKKVKAEFRAGYTFAMQGFWDNSSDPKDKFNYHGWNGQVLLGIRMAPRFVVSAVAGFSYWWYRNNWINASASPAQYIIFFQELTSSEVRGFSGGLEFEHQYEWKKFDMAICAGLTAGILTGTSTAMEGPGWGPQQQHYPVTTERRFAVINVMFGCKFAYKKRIGKK